MATLLDQLKLIIGVETKGFGAVQTQIKGLNEFATRQLTQLKTAVAGYFTVQAARELVTSVARMADHWKDVSEQTGLSLEKVQQYERAFKKVGLTVEDAAKAFEVLTDKRREALENGGPAARLFQDFGIGEAELRGMGSGEEVFKRLAQGRSATNQRDRELFNQMFGTRRGGKILAGATEFANQGPINTASDQNIILLDKASKEFALAVHEFKVATIPFVTALMGVAGAGMNQVANQQSIWSKLATANPLSGGAILGRALEFFTRPDPKTAPSAVARSAIVPPSGIIPPASEHQYERYPAEVEAARKKMQDAFDNVFFKAGNMQNRRAMMHSNMQRDLSEASRLEGLGRFAEADALRAGAIRQAGELSGFDSRRGLSIGADPSAAIGGFIGGAAAGIDPTLLAQQQTNDILLRILNEFPELEAALREYRSPINQLQ